MKNLKISTKLFLFTSLILIMVFGIQWIMQGVFFGEFYEKRKAKTITDVVDEFKEFYEEHYDEEDKLTDEIERIRKSNEVNIFVTNKEGEAELWADNLPKYNIVFKQDSGNQEVLYTELFMEDLLFNQELKSGQKIKIFGFKDEDGYVEANRIYIDDKLIFEMSEGMSLEGGFEEYENYDDEDYGDFAYVFDEQVISGEIVYATKENEEYTDNQYEMTFMETYISNNQIIELKEPELIEDEMTGLSSLMYTKQAKVEDETSQIIGIISLKPVNEAASIISDYQRYVFLIGIALIVVASLIYSKLISKPLINMKNVAEEMAALNFDVELEVSSNDEIGSLSKSLNTLSNTLGDTIGELEQANKKLKADIERERELERQRKEFVASVSHELKTPLCVVKGFAEGMKDGVYKDNEKYLTSIVEEVDSMGELVMDMLEISRLESGFYKLKEVEFDISRLLRSVVKKFEAMTLEKNISIINESKNFVVSGDTTKISQVVSNLVSNGIRYSSRDEKIFVRTIDKNESIRIEVENTGAHIEEKELEKIWDGFYRVEKSRSKHLGGTGLGLKIVKQILDMHNSKYGVKNTDNGVLFYFELNKIDIEEKLSE